MAVTLDDAILAREHAVELLKALRRIANAIDDVDESSHHKKRAARLIKLEQAAREGRGLLVRLNLQYTRPA